MLIKTSELTGAALDVAVARCEGLIAREYGFWTPSCKGEQLAFDVPHFSTDWSKGGPIVEREGLNLEHLGRDAFAIHPRWCAWTSNLTWPNGEVQVYGPSPLIAAMRCYVASKLGDEVEVPDELMEAA